MIHSQVMIKKVEIKKLSLKIK